MEALGDLDALGDFEGDSEALGDVLKLDELDGEPELDGLTDWLTVVVVIACQRPSASTLAPLSMAIEPMP